MPNKFDLKLKDLAYKSIDKLLMQGKFDQSAFDNLYDHLHAKADQLKSENTVSKQIISAILNAANVLENNAGNQEMANRFMMLLGLIAIGETPDDRKPGVPRII